MKKSKFFAVAAVCAAIVWACAPKTTTVDFNNVPNTERCQFMKDACKEAHAFQSKYESMSSEDKKEAKAILNAYIQQCESAQDLCRKSVE